MVVLSFQEISQHHAHDQAAGVRKVIRMDDCPKDKSVQGPGQEKISVVALE